MKDQRKSIQSQVCTLANSIKKEGVSLSEAFRKAWQVVKLKTFLRSGGRAIVAFFKADGEKAERTASGISGENYEAKGSDRKGNTLQVPYFDQLRGAVRSFNATRFAGWSVA